MRKGLIFVILLLFNVLFLYGVGYANQIMEGNNFLIYLNEDNKPVIEEIDPANDHSMDTEFNGESIEAIGEKIEIVLTKTDLEGLGNYISKTSITKGVNPYLVGGIILENTNCKNECTILFKQCNNVFSIKGNPGCFGGLYKKYKNVQSGIDDLISMIFSKFNDSEEQVPYKVFSSFGKNETWAYKVNKYMDILKTAK